MAEISKELILGIDGVGIIVAPSISTLLYRTAKIYLRYRKRWPRKDPEIWPYVLNTPAGRFSGPTLVMVFLEYLRERRARSL